MLGLALEGGGARGAYHVGVIKALIENGCAFDGFVGTSIGAINAAMMAQGSFEQLQEAWMGISFEHLFDEEEQHLLKYLDTRGLKLAPELPRNILKVLSKIKGGGINTEKMKAFLKGHIDEKRVRESGKDFGLVTMGVSDRKPLELMLEDIPQGQLVNYIMASASFPGFQFETIDGKMFVDGAFHNNCPYHLLIKKGYQQIIAIRTKSLGVFRKPQDTEKVKIIEPKDDLGQLMLFTPERSAANIQLGYYDGLRYARNLRGGSYYIESADVSAVCAQLMSIPDPDIIELGHMLNIPPMPAKRMLFEKIIPQLSGHLKLGKGYDYADFAVALLEQAAHQRKVERFRVYTYDYFCHTVKEKPVAAKKMLKVMQGKKATALAYLTTHFLTV